MLKKMGRETSSERLAAAKRRVNEVEEWLVG